MVTIETKGDIRVVPCPKCGTMITVANAPPSNHMGGTYSCKKCQTMFRVKRLK